MFSICQAKNLISVLAIFIPVIRAFKKAYISPAAKNSLPFSLKTSSLKRTLCIHYLFRFNKDQVEVQALLNSGNEVNTMASAYAASFGLEVRSNIIRAKKIDDSIFQIFDMLIASFRINNKLGQSRFF